MSMASAGRGTHHVSQVRYLYKTILRLHRGLPPELKALGDKYTKAEFKRHKRVEPEFVGPFMKEWAKYALELAKQLQEKDLQGVKFGTSINPRLLDSMSDEQVTQMYELFKETNKPVDPENPLGENPVVSDNSKPGTL